jgi:hypothetical protein
VTGPIVRTGLVVPAGGDRPTRTVTWTGDALLELLYGEIGCDTVDALQHDDLTVWVADDGWYREPRLPRNRRIEKLLAVDDPLLGAAVITGTADADGVTLGLDAAELARLISLCPTAVTR